MGKLDFIPRKFGLIMNQIIRSCYRNSEAEQFELEILGETTDMGEPAYFVRILPKWKKERKPLEIK